MYPYDMYKSPKYASFPKPYSYPPLDGVIFISTLLSVLLTEACAMIVLVVVIPHPSSCIMQSPKEPRCPVLSWRRAGSFVQVFPYPVGSRKTYNAAPNLTRVR
jgi:hypothetical protein